MPDKSGSGIFYGWIIVGAASTVVALQWGCNQTYGIFLTELCEDLGWSKTVVSGAYSMGFMLGTILGVMAGRLNDRYGPRLMLMISIVSVSSGLALMSTMNSTWQLYLFYGFIVNVGLAFAWVPAVSTVARWFILKRGMALGITQGGIGVVILLMMPFAQFLINSFGWRSSYVILAGILLVLCLPVSRLMILNPSDKGLNPDGIPVTAESEGNSSLKSNTRNSTLKQAVKTKQFCMLFMVCAIFTLSIGTSIHLKAYVIGFGISEMTAATIMGLRSGASAVGTIIMSKLSDRIGRRIPLAISFLVMALMMFWLMKARQPWEFYLFSVISGFAGGSYALFAAIVADWFGTKFHGSIYGMVAVGEGIGGAIGPLFAGYICDTTGSYEMAIIIGAAAFFIGTALSLIIKAPQATKATW